MNRAVLALQFKNMKKKHFMLLYLTASLLLLFLLAGCGNAANEPPASETPLGEVASGKDSRPTESPEPAETPEPTEEVGTEEKFEPLPPGQKYGKIRVSKDKKTIYVHGWVDPYELSDRRTKRAEKIVFCRDAGILTEESDVDSSFDPTYSPHLYDAPLVKEVVVEKGNPFLYAINGMLIKRKGADRYTYGDLLVFCVPRKKGAIQVPEGVEYIGSCAFWGCSDITSVRLPGSLLGIGGASFADMDSCTNIQADKTSNIFYTKDGVLYSCDFLEYTSVLAYPAGKTEQIYKAPKNTWIIYVGAFLGADHLREVRLPSGQQRIYDYAFRDCINLRKVNVKNKKKISLVEKNAFNGCPRLKEHVKDKNWLPIDDKK